MNILLINPNSHNPNTKPPLGLLSVGTVCKEAGYEVQILDAALLNLSAREVAERVRDADIVGLTAMTPMYPEAVNIATEIKMVAPKLPVVIGGVHASIFPEEVYRAGVFDAVVVGEGEYAMQRLLIDAQSRFGDGLKPMYEVKEYADIPTPDYSLIDLYAYKPRPPHARRLPWATAQTSRGCPYSCTFCSSIFGHKHRGMPPEQVLRMLGLLSKGYGIKDITFYDDEFTMDRERVMRLCGLIIDSRLDITWSCEARVDMVDTVLLAVMRNAGCRLIYYGIESGNQDIINTLDKRITLDDVRKAVRWTRGEGIAAAGYFMLGCPGENHQTMRQTVDFAVELGLDHAQFSVCSPLPGSRLYEQYGKGQSWGNFQYLARGNKVACSTGLDIEEIEEAVEEANAIFRKEGIKL